VTVTSYETLPADAPYDDSPVIVTVTEGDPGVPFYDDLEPVTVIVTDWGGMPAGPFADSPTSLMTIPPETIAVPGQETITIPGSVVTITGAWPPPGAGQSTPITDPNDPDWAPTATRPRNGWTAVEAETPYSPGPDPPRSTAFFEPAVSGKSAGIPLLETPAKCGPNSPRCDDERYCDPQPLCQGQDCPGVCLPFYGGKYSQPDGVRAQIWDKVMAEGIYVVVVNVREIRQMVGNATLATVVRENVARTALW
jgi:hypothetical protein